MIIIGGYWGLGVCVDLPLEGCIFSLAVILIPFPLCTGAKTEAEKAVKDITVKA